jgi:hypothetical protein
MAAAGEPAPLDRVARDPGAHGLRPSELPRDSTAGTGIGVTAGVGVMSGPDPEVGPARKLLNIVSECSTLTGHLIPTNTPTIRGLAWDDLNIGSPSI